MTMDETENTEFPFLRKHKEDGFPSENTGETIVIASAKQKDQMIV